MNKKEGNMRILSSSLFVPIVILFIVIVTVIVIVFFVDKKYEIIVDGKKYVCTKREKINYKNDALIGVSKKDFNSLEEAMEACKQDEVAVYSSTGELEEYQEAMKTCEYKDEDLETYYFYQDGVYSYKHCQEIK